MLSCYIMLTEYYEKQGNTEKSIEYFNYYSSLQKHVQAEENKEKMKKVEDRTKYAALLEMVQERFVDIVKEEVQKAIASDETAISELFDSYISNVKAYTKYKYQYKN